VNKARTLVIDDETGWIEVCKDCLAGDGVDVTGATEVHTGTRLLKQEAFDLLIVDLKLPDGSGLDLVRAAKEVDSDLPIIIITAYPTVQTAVEAVRCGAYDYIVKPFKTEQLRVVVRRALERRRLCVENRLLAEHVQGRRRGDARLVGESPQFVRIREQIAKVAPTESEVLVTGESGTGKELVARAIHGQSKRRDRPFVPVDCGALPETLVEAELFGHEKGAFTGANQKQIGLLDFADGGTVFFDEIGELAPTSQAKLLRLLQERSFRRLGGRETIKANVRLIAATNRKLDEEVRAGHFRLDLYYRLNVFEISMPPLRERRGDLPLLIDRLIGEVGRELGVAPREIGAATMSIITRYDWPGNVRELRNTIKRGLILAGEGPIRTEHLPPYMMKLLAAEASEVEASGGSFQVERQRAIDCFERQFLTELLQRNFGNVTSACEEAGLSRSSLYFSLHRHGIEPAAFRGNQDD